MTPKEKAEEMFHKFYGVKAYNEMCNMTMFEAKQCALIAVDEIINNSKRKGKTIFNLPFNSENEILLCNHEYWQQVKREIKKL